MDNVRLKRIKTVEDPEKRTKHVLFEILPTMTLYNGKSVYPGGISYEDRIVCCEWSHFLRLVRWTKKVADKAPDVQAQIAVAHARIRPLSGSPKPVFMVEAATIDHASYALFAIKDPVLKTGSNGSNG